jgi:hypothetical protein
MAAESTPLTLYDKKTASYQAKLSALGTLSGSVSTFQNSLSALTNSNNFRAVSATPSTRWYCRPAPAKAVAGSYNINVSQLAQAQTLTSGGMASKLSTIGRAPRPRFPSSWARQRAALRRQGCNAGRQHPADGREQRLADHQRHGHPHGRQHEERAHWPTPSMPRAAPRA